MSTVLERPTSAVASAAPDVKTIAVSGATGLVGNKLCSSLREQHHRVMRLVRSDARDMDDVLWDVENGMANKERLEGTDAIVHLAGENIAGGRWNERKKGRIRYSRIRGTHSLCTDLAALKQKPEVLVCASAIGFYGDQGARVLTESADGGSGFLPDVCREWEAACAPAVDVGIRVVNLRIGVVISRDGGALKEMLTPFRMGVGGKIGSGQQYWSWVAIDDVIGAIEHAIHHEELSGPVNCVSPNPVTNYDFTKTLGRVMSKPTIFPLPAFMAKLVLGEMAKNLLLASTRIVPKKLQDSGYSFHHTNLESALRQEL